MCLVSLVSLLWSVTIHSTEMLHIYCMYKRNWKRSHRIILFIKTSPKNVMYIHSMSGASPDTPNDLPSNCTGLLLLHSTNVHRSQRAFHLAEGTMCLVVSMYVNIKYIFNQMINIFLISGHIHNVVLQTPWFLPTFSIHPAHR